MNNNKLVSVCMCTRNRAYRMLPAIKCILDQTYRNFELILVDDQSPDLCPVICDQYALKFHCLSYP